jgi:hypothetical protein
MCMNQDNIAPYHAICPRCKCTDKTWVHYSLGDIVQKYKVGRGMDIPVPEGLHVERYNHFSYRVIVECVVYTCNACFYQWTTDIPTYLDNCGRDIGLIQ